MTSFRAGTTPGRGPASDSSLSKFLTILPRCRSNALSKVKPGHVAYQLKYLTDCYEQ